MLACGFSFAPTRRILGSMHLTSRTLDKMSSSQRSHLARPEQITPNVPPRLVTPANKLPPKPTLPAVLGEGLRAIFPEPPARDMPDEFLTPLQRLDAKPPSRTAD
jgi:hypothetical protein